MATRKCNKAWLALCFIPLANATDLTVSLVSDHFKDRNPQAQGCECSREDFVEKNWGLGISQDKTRYHRFRDVEFRKFNLDAYIYTDSFGKPAAFIGRGEEIKVPKIPLWFGYRYGLSSRHDFSHWVPFPMGYGTATLKLNPQAEATLLIIPGVVMAFGLRMKL